ARWEARFGGNAGEREGRERRLFGGFDDDGVSARECRRDFPRGCLEWEIPRYDRRANTHRLTACVVQVWAGYREDFALDLVGPSRIIAEALDGVAQVDAPCLAQRLAVVQRLEAGEGVRITFDEIGDTVENAASFAARHRRPGLRFQRAPGRGDSEVDIRVSRFGNPREDLARRGIIGLERPSIPGLAPFAADVQPFDLRSHRGPSGHRRSPSRGG